MIVKNICRWLGILIMFQAVVLEPVFLNAQDEVNPNDIAQTIEKMKGAKSWPEMAALITTLCKFGQPASSYILKEFQDKNNDKWLRKVLAEILAGLKDKETIPGIVKVLQDEKETPFIRSNAAQCLGMMGLPEASEPLIRELKNNNAKIRSMAVFSLGLLKDQDAISEIGEATKDKDELVRNRAARALGKLENPVGIDYLIPLLNDNVFHVRLAAIQSLGIIGTEKVVNPLVERMSVADEETEKATIIQALGKTKNQKAADPLIKVLQNESSFLAMNAAEALASIGDKRAIPLIENRMKTEKDSFAREKFDKAYKKLTQ
ncbi:MAG: HEAT repeat domain-containing protein [Candidatus Theseobacter exili]|nr:HEAT repeat domain-containing protein [Candidatus Theseobacter exili]